MLVLQDLLIHIGLGMSRPSICRSLTVAMSAGSEHLGSPGLWRRLSRTTVKLTGTMS